MSSQPFTILTFIDSYIEPLLLRVLSTDKLGICRGTIEVDSISSSCGQDKRDRFKLSIPYARHNLTWNVLFDSQCPELGPDFIFNDNHFLADMDVDTLSNKLPSLAKWNPSDGNALLNVLVELLACYKQYQIHLLQRQGRLQCEYTMLMKSQLLKPEDVEIIMLPSTSKPTEARFLISLSVNNSTLPNLRRVLNSNTIIAMLFVTFSGTDWTRIIPELYLAKPLEEFLVGTGPFYLPHFPAEKCLVDYVSEINEYIVGKVNLVAESNGKRIDYLATVLRLNYGSCLEFDSTNSTYIANLFSEDDFYFILHIQLPLGFPREAPITHLRSIYHMISEGVPYSERIDNYPYDPTWTADYMYEKLRNFIKEYVKEFKSNSIKRCS